MTGTESVLRRVIGCAAALIIGVGPLLAAAPVGAQASAEWNIAMVGGPASGSGVTIAVVDTGVDVDHVAFGGRVVPGIDLVDDDQNPDDGNGHGTHVAGIAAGGGIKCGDRSPASIGVAPQAAILPVRVLDDQGAGNLDDVNAGIRQAADRGATVINLSLSESPRLLGMGSGRASFVDAINYAWSTGSIPVLAAGNNGEGLLGNLLFPDGYGSVKAVVVTAVNEGNQRASYASGSSSATWGMAAPGGDSGRPITSAWKGNNCMNAMGTSMAAPHVAGALAVLRARGLSQQQAVDRVLATAAPSGSATGAGLLNLTEALAGLPDPSATPPPAPPSSNAPTTAATPTTVAAGTSTSTTTQGSTTTTESSTTTTEATVKADGRTPPSLPVEDDSERAADLTLVSDGDDIPGAAVVAAALGVTLVWFAWIAGFRRRLFS